MIWPFILIVAIAIPVSIYSKRYSYFLSIKAQEEGYCVKGLLGLFRLTINAREVEFIEERNPFTGGFFVVLKGLQTPLIGIILPTDKILIFRRGNDRYFAISARLCKDKMVDIMNLYQSRGSSGRGTAKGHCQEVGP